MAKRLSEKEIEEIVKCFTIGKTIDELSIQFNCTKSTISRNLKKNLGEEKFKEFIQNSKTLSEVINNEKNKVSLVKENNKVSLVKENNLKKNRYEEKLYQEKVISNDKQDQFSTLNSFMEIAPLDYQIEENPQKDLSSIPISEIEFPKVVYLIVDKKIELEIKYLKDYPDWLFLSKDELNRKTIEIFIDMKNAKRFCSKEQKVIKVPNTEVFRIVAPILLSRGISRIVNSDKLIAL